MRLQEVGGNDRDKVYMLKPTRYSDKAVKRKWGTLRDREVEAG